MAILKERQAELATIRKLPISPRLAAVLVGAAEDAGIDEVFVYSGGQEKAPSKKRTGSPRHDGGNAADLWLTVKGRHPAISAPSSRAVGRTKCRCSATERTGASDDPRPHHRADCWADPHSSGVPADPIFLTD